MANQIRIKRRSSSGSSGAPSALKNGELAFNEADNTLYYGYGDDGSGNATSIPAIGGLGGADGTRSDYLETAYVTLDTSQSIDSGKTILTGNTWTYNSGSTLNVAGTFQLGGTTVTADATELNHLDGITGVGISQNNIFKADAGVVDNDFLRVNGTVIEGRSAAEVAADIGAITTLAGAEGIDVSGTGQSRSITLDLTELPDMTAAVTRTEDELIILDNGDQSRKLISEIDLSDFNNDLSLSDFVDDVTVTYSVSASTTTGGAKLDLSDTNSPATVDSVSFLGSGATTVTRTDADTITISSTNTTYTAGTNGGLSLAGTSFSMNFGNLPDYSTSPAGTDHLIIGTTGGASRVDLDDIPLNIFDDSGTISVTGVGTLTDLEVTNDVDITSGDLNITAGDITLTAGALKGPSTFYIDPSPDDTGEPGGATTDTGTVVILGDLTVQGTTTTVNSTVVEIVDPTFNLASNSSGSGLVGAGIIIGDGTADKTMTIGSGGDFTFNDGIVAVGASLSADLDMNGNEILDAVIDGGTF